jgi:BTB/POZ domain-containing protein 9
VKFIRIVGTNNTVNRVFHVVAFEAMFTDIPVTLSNGLVGKNGNSVGLIKHCSQYITNYYRSVDSSKA